MLDLFLACRSGDCEIIDRIILGGIDVNARNNDPITIEENDDAITIEGITPLEILAGHRDLAATFIECTPLHIACYYRKIEVVELLLSKLGADITMIAREIRHHFSGEVWCRWRFESVTALHITVCGDHINCDKSLVNYVLLHITKNDIDVVETKATSVEKWLFGKPYLSMERGTAFHLALAFLDDEPEIFEDLVVLGRACRGVGDFSFDHITNDPRFLPFNEDFEYVFYLNLDEITKYKEELCKALSDGLKDMPDYIIDCVKDFAEPTTQELLKGVHVPNNNDVTKHDFI